MGLIARAAAADPGSKRFCFRVASAGFNQAFKRRLQKRFLARLGCENGARANDAEERFSPSRAPNSGAIARGLSWSRIYSAPLGFLFVDRWLCSAPTSLGLRPEPVLIPHCAHRLGQGSRKRPENRIGANRCFVGLFASPTAAIAVILDPRESPLNRRATIARAAAARSVRYSSWRKFPPPRSGRFPAPSPHRSRGAAALPHSNRPSPL